MVGKVRDRAPEKGSGSTGEHLPTAGIIEGAAGELGKGFEIERPESRATQGRAGNVPKLAADSRAAVTWQDVNDVDLDAPRNDLLARRTAADEPHHLILDRGDHVESVRRLQRRSPVRGASNEVRRRPFARQRRHRVVSRRDMNARNALGIGLSSATDDYWFGAHD